MDQEWIGVETRGLGGVGTRVDRGWAPSALSPKGRSLADPVIIEHKF